jgi:ketosteroid isomerase-like protein
MSDQNSLAVVQGAYQSFQRGDIPAVLEALSDDIQWDTPKVVGAPFGGPYSGRAAVAEFFGELTAAENVEVFEPREFITEGERVAAIVAYRARVKATGRLNETTLVHIFTVRAGKVTRFLELYDTAAVERAYQQVASA